MGLMDRIKSPENKGWNDIEARIRQRWRIYPDRKVAIASVTKQFEFTDSSDSIERDEQKPINPGDILEMMARADLSPHAASREEPAITQGSNTDKDEARKPIVSINGKDIDEGELDDSQTKDKNAA
jgi:hypothetical protein